MLIAHTQASIVLATKPVGARVNIEVDMVGKYVEKAVLASLGGDSGDAGSGLTGIVERVVEKVLARKSIAWYVIVPPLPLSRLTRPQSTLRR